MSVKIRELRSGQFYIVIHWRGRRKTKLIGSRERAVEVAERLRVALDLYGFDAIRSLEPAQVASKPSIQEFGESWMDELEASGLKRSTIMTYCVMLRQHVLPALGALRIDDLTYRHIKRFAKEKGASHARASVKLMLAVLHAMLEEARVEELIASNPVIRTSRLYRSTGERMRAIENKDVFTLDELHTVESCCRENYPDAFPFVLSLSRTGMRVGEVTALRWTDIDFARRLAHVRHNRPWHGEEGTPKTKAGLRYVEMSDELCAALLALREQREKERRAKGRTHIPEHVFVTSLGTPINSGDFRERIWYPLLRKAGVKQLRVHDLRHTFATLHLAAGASVVWVKEQLGHSSIQITVDLYKHWIPSENRDRSNRLDRVENGNENANNAQTGAEGEGNSGSGDDE